MTNQRIDFGQIGEELAVDFLVRNGYQIVEKNFRNKLGEIDIIAMDDDVLCFVEVKTRHADSVDSALEAVTASKRRQIGKVAQSYLMVKGDLEVVARFDVIGITMDQEQKPQIELIKDAFELAGS